MGPPDGEAGARGKTGLGDKTDLKNVFIDWKEPPLGVKLYDPLAIFSSRIFSGVN